MGPIPDDLLRKLGGWQAMQEARRLVAAGLVTGATRTNDRFAGRVTGAGRGVGAVTLVVRSATEATVACGCPEARRGLVCAHGLAVALAWNADYAKSVKSPAQEKPGAGANFHGEHVKGNATDSGSDGSDGSDRSIVRCPRNLRDFWKNGSLPLVFQRVANSEHSPGQLGVPGAFLAQALGVAVVPPGARVDASATARILQAMAEGGAVLEAPDGPFEVTGERWRPGVLVSWSGEDARLEWTGDRGQAGPGGWILADGMICPPPDWSAFDASDRAVLEKSWRQGTPVDRPAPWLVRHLDALGAVCRLAGAEGLVIDDRPPAIHIRLDGSLQRLTARLTADYDGQKVELPASAESANRFPMPVAGPPHAWRNRNPAAEQAVLGKLEKLGFSQVAGSCQSFVMNGEGNVLTFFASSGRIVPEGWRITWGDRFRAASQVVEQARFEWRPLTGGGPGWLEGEVVCRTPGDIHVSRVEIMRLLRSGRSHFQTEQGRRVVLDTALAADLNEVWQDIGAVQTSPGVFRFDVRQAAYLKLTLGEPEAGRELPVIDEATAGPAAGLLRPYQRAGVAWLAGQSAIGLGAMLADDMGLGKTLQTQVFLEWQRRQGGEGPALVVCPTSLISTWVDEAARFHPRWKVMVLHGAGRAEYREVMDAADLVVTSYALVGRDIEHYEGREFRAVVLDEASLVRNPDTQSSKAVRKLRGKARVALTGTPVENSVRDLWSVFEFVQPGYLGARKEFHQRYELPMAAGADPAVGARLHRRTRPLLLRRRKDEVAADLPARIEKTEWCDLEGAQADLYNAILRESRDKVTQDIRSRGFDGARMSVLTALLRLRQVCCDPALLPGDAGKVAAGGAKREAFRELVREAREGGHRVLVFSQFVQMLELLRAEAVAAGIPHAWLTGASTDRADQVRAFQAGGCDLFFLSLKAGGYGLTLTAADTVILYDPWWNPAVEAQAIDRAHRIGQVKSVNAYRLVTRGTVEEKILQLQKKKRGASASVLGDEAGSLGPLGDDDLRELLGI